MSHSYAITSTPDRGHALLMVVLCLLICLPVPHALFEAFGIHSPYL